MTHSWRGGKSISCCYKCEDRTPGCHASCRDYKEFSADRQEVYRQREIYSGATRTRWRKELAPKKMR